MIGRPLFSISNIHALPLNLVLAFIIYKTVPLRDVRPFFGQRRRGESVASLAHWAANAETTFYLSH
jgi:hypothetical protein